MSTFILNHVFLCPEIGMANIFFSIILGHFLEERILEEKGTSPYRRRYSTTSQNGEKKYLHVTDAGDLILVHVIIY